MKREILTAESVRAGHPDKLCDYIADCVLDACLRADKSSRCACEVMAAGRHILVAGEITCRARIDIRLLVRQALYRLGYNPFLFLISVHVRRQSRDIADGVNLSLEARSGDTSAFANPGAGDQGTVYGYAVNDGPEYMPLPLVLAHQICSGLDKARKDNTIPGLKPDGKAQVSIAYEDGKPVHVESIVVSVQHASNKDASILAGEIRSEVLLPVFRRFPFDGATEILINPAGRFVEGGPMADTGLTGRKIMVDTYGGLARHGGGAFSGKDPTKVDRSGAYMARYIAKNIVAAALAEKCLVSISYAIGKADPVAVSVDTLGTGRVSDAVLEKAVRDVFNMRPGAIIQAFELRRISYSRLSAYGHFGKIPAPWERCDKYSELMEAVKKHGG